MFAGRLRTETALARVIAVFGAAKPRCAYLFANRIKVLVHDGVGINHSDFINETLPFSGLHQSCLEIISYMTWPDAYFQAVLASADGFLASGEIAVR